MKKIKSILLIGFLLFIVYLMIKTQLPLLLGKDNYIKECQSSSYNISICSKNKDLSIQERYDMFYNNYNKFFDDGFVNRYTFIYIECLENPNQCKIKEITQNTEEFYKSRIAQNKQLCIDNYYPNCIANEINPKILENENNMSNYTKKEKIKLFENSMLKNYQKNETLCISFSEFYNNLTKEDKEKLNPIVVQQCDNLKKLGVGRF